MKSAGVFLNITTNDHKTLEERIGFIRSLEGVNHIELWLEYATWSEEDSEWLKQQLAEFDLIMHAPFINISFVADQKEIREASVAIMKRAFDHARLLGVKVVTVHVGWRPLYMSADEAFALALPAMQELVQYAKDDFRVSIENLPENFGTMIRYPVALQEVADILKKIPELYATVDLGHCLQNNDTYEEFFTSYTDRISNIHVHNAQLKRKAHFGFEEKGDIDLQQFLRFLKKIQYKNYFTFEILGDEKIRSSWEFLKRVV